MSIVLTGVTVMLGDVPALAAVDAVFEPGTLTGVIGPNGAGKSTLARAALGLLRHSGSITIDGVEAAALRPRDRARAIAWLPQGQSLHWPLSVERLVALGRLPHLAPLQRIGPADRAAIDAAMVEADVAHLRARTVTELSGGERARAMLARALATGAGALIADEPLAALDPAHQLATMALLRSRAAAGSTVIAMLHDLTLAARHCDRLILLDRGRVAAAGVPDTVLTDANLAAVYGVRAWRGDADGAPLIVPLPA